MYVPLRVYSPYSVGFGAIKTNELVDFCVAEGIPAAGVADRNSLSGVMANSKGLSAKGIQPLMGATVRISHAGIDGDLVLYATSQVGYKSLLGLVNRYNLSPSAQATALTDLEGQLGSGAQEMIALTAGASGLVDKIAAGKGCARSALEILARVFRGSTYVEIQRPEGKPAATEATMVDLASALALPLVATQEAHYASADMKSAHDAFLCIADKSYIAEAGRRHAADGCYLVSAADMKQRFSDIPEAITNTVEIARRASFMVEPQAPRLPAFETDNGESEQDCLTRLAHEGLNKRLAAISALDEVASNEAYRNRLDYELGVIGKMGFPGYFLIVADFIGWAKSQDIPVGPGRGSGAGSLVAYALGITDIDPLQFGLLFERFLNPERVSMPDFDIDFAKARRDEVIEYVRGKYGADHVAHIASFGTLQARAVVRDVGRVMQIAYPVVDQYAKMIPQNPSNPVTLGEAMEEEGLAQEIEKAGDDIKALFRIALQLEGLYRHVSTHAAGMIISDQPIADVVPVHRDKDGKLSTSFEMKAVEAAGLVKFDFLGLKNLDIVDGALDFIESTKGERPDLNILNFVDQRTYAQLASGDGFGVFQLESMGMRRAMKDLAIDTIEELIALISLYRPGPMEQIDTYAAVKRGEEEIHYLHPEMQEVLEPTNGVMIYQEQVMEIARRVAGYSLGDADLLRRAMGKKIKSEMDAQRERFCDGAAQGWVEITLDNGQTKTVHALTRFATNDGSGRTVTLQEAIDEGLDIAA